MGDTDSRQADARILVNPDHLALEIARYARAFDKEKDLPGDNEYDDCMTWEDLARLIVRRAAL